MERAISELGEKVSGVLQKQETEFLSAYRIHERNVEKDFIDLRDEIEEKEKAIADNVKVKQLEKERDWYKKEALHLDQVLLKTKKKENELREKVDELEEDRKWLSNQLKLLMTHKHMLERQVEILKEDKESGENLSVDLQENDISNQCDLEINSTTTPIQQNNHDVAT